MMNDISEQELMAWVEKNPPSPEKWVFAQDFKAVNGWDGRGVVSVRPLHPRWDIVRRDLKLNNR